MLERASAPPKGGRATPKLIFVTISEHNRLYVDNPMTFFRQNIAPLIVVLVFLFALVTMSARIFLPTDMSGPAPLTGSVFVSSLLMLLGL
jgi:hypothetical protein